MLTKKWKELHEGQKGIGKYLGAGVGGALVIRHGPRANHLTQILNLKHLIIVKMPVLPNVLQVKAETTCKCLNPKSH